MTQAAKRRLLFDVETDGLLAQVTRAHLLIARDLDTKERFCYREHDFGWMQLFDEAELVVGHNIIAYDFAVLYKLYGYQLPSSVRIHDTLLMSQILNYRRFGMEGHSLDTWGKYLGLPKIVFNEWGAYSLAMEIYCDRDLDINTKVYEILCWEFEDLSVESPKLGLFLKNEHKASLWQQRAQLHGWPMARAKMLALFDEISAKLNEAERLLLPLLGHKFVYLDKIAGKPISKAAGITKAGLYYASIANYFDIDPREATEFGDKPLQGAFTRVSLEALKLSSPDDVKRFLYRQGWEPTEWNTKRDENTRKMVRTSPKISEDDLEFLGKDGALYREYTKASARYGILKTWIANLSDADRLHGDSMMIGTPSMRVRHSITANIPSAEAAYGKEFRTIFETLPGYTLIGCDSAGNQARGLAHYLNDAGFTHTLLNGDIHQYNADILTSIVNRIDGVPLNFVVPRSAAKRILYAFLFGASGAKLWGYIFGSADIKRGAELKAQFVKAVPGFEALLKQLDAIFGNTKKQTGYGWIPSIAGNKIYVDSFHKLLVYLLQSCEKATCSAALAMTMDDLEAEGIPYVPLIYYHDEIDFMVPDEFKERAALIGKRAFKEAPKLYGIEIMDGEAKTGLNWLEIH